MLDNIWIFVVIIGAVISIAQKNQQKQRNAESNDEPSLDPQAELERRMQSIGYEVVTARGDVRRV